MTEVDADTAEALALAAIRQQRERPGIPTSVGPWIVEQSATGFNGVVWRARAGTAGELAIKLSKIDARERGRREFAATIRLAESGLDVAPRPFAVVAEGDVSALVSTWCPGDRLEMLPNSDAVFFETMVATYAQVHRVDHAGLPVAADGSSIEDYLDRAAAYADHAGRRNFARLLGEIRRKIGFDLPTVHSAALIHGDANCTNMLLERGTLRLVDWEYSGVGDPCADLAGFCTSPGHLDMSSELRVRLVRAHALALGAEELVERTQAFVIASLAMWCARTGTSSMYARMDGAVPNPRFDVSVRADHYRARLAEALDLDRTAVELALEV